METNTNQDYSGLTSKTFLTRSQINRIFGKELSNQEIEELLFSGKVNKHFSYYKLGEIILRELKIIPKKVQIAPEYYSKISKGNAFTLKLIAEMFGGLNKDTVKLVADKYFYKKYNYYYKSDAFGEMLSGGQEEFEI